MRSSGVEMEASTSMNDESYHESIDVSANEPAYVLLQVAFSLIAAAMMELPGFTYLAFAVSFVFLALYATPYVTGSPKPAQKVITERRPPSSKKKVKTVAQKQ